MVARQSKGQQQTVARVMHEFKHGELKRQGDGAKVKNPKQAIAIALHEAGATNQESATANKRNLRKTKAQEGASETAQSRREGRAAQDATTQRAARRKAATDSRSKSDLYAEAERRDIAGRAKMSKRQLEDALRR